MLFLLRNPQAPRVEPASGPTPANAPAPAETSPADHSPSPGGDSPCTEPIAMTNYSRALQLAENHPSQRACIEVPPPTGDMSEKAYARILLYKALGLQERGDTDEAIATLEESLRYDPSPGTRVAVARAYHSQGKLDEARKELAKAAILAMSDGAGAGALEDLFFTQVMVDRDLYLRDRDDASKEQLCHSCDRFMDLSWHHSFSKENTDAVKAVAKEHCAGVPAREPH